MKPLQTYNNYATVKYRSFLNAVIPFYNNPHIKLRYKYIAL